MSVDDHIYYKWVYDNTYLATNSKEWKDPLENVLMPAGRYVHKDGWEIEVQEELSVETLKHCSVKYKGSLKRSGWHNITSRTDLRFFLEQFRAKRFFESKLDVGGLL